MEREGGRDGGERDGEGGMEREMKGEMERQRKGGRDGGGNGEMDGEGEKGREGWRGRWRGKWRESAAGSPQAPAETTRLKEPYSLLKPLHLFFLSITLSSSHTALCSFNCFFASNLFDFLSILLLHLQSSSCVFCPAGDI